MQLIIYLYISSILIFNSAFAETPKRAPLGFSAVRGKKSEPNYEYQNQNYLEEFLRNEDPSLAQSNNVYYSGIRNDPEVDPEWVRVPYSALNNDGRSELWNGDDDDSSLGKRSPYGFVGVRGKKLSASQGSEKNDDSDVTSLRKKKEVEFFQYDRKRVPYAFLGMRGKKENLLSYYKAKDQYGDKRAPMGFIGMRGKKSDDGWATRYEKTG